MGADLYIKDLPKEKGGYFRDSYNSWNLFWQFQMDYWGIITNKYTKDGIISPEKARDLLKTLKRRENIFEMNMILLKKKRNLYWDFRLYAKGKQMKMLKTPIWTPNKELDRKGAEEYYRKRYEKFKIFLGGAIKRNLPIEASL